MLESYQLLIDAAMHYVGGWSDAQAERKIGILCGPGNGDVARGLAFASTVHRQYPDAAIFIISWVSQWTPAPIEPLETVNQNP